MFFFQPLERALDTAGMDLHPKAPGHKVGQYGSARRIVFLILTTVLASSAVGVGIAVGAYGTRVMSAVAIHLPVEFAALSPGGKNRT